MPKPIRRSDGHVLNSANADGSVNADSDDTLIEKTIKALTGEIERKKSVVNQEPLVRRSEQPTQVVSTKELLAESTRIWEQYKKELVDDLNRCSRQGHLYDRSDDADIDVSTYTVKE